MKRFKRIANLCAVVMMSATIALSVITPALAESSASLSIEPKKNYVIEPGKSVDDKMTIRNLDSSAELKLTLRVVDFSYTDNGGTPKLMLDPDAPQTTWSLKPFLSAPESVSIPPSSSRTVDLKVSIPANQGAGSYYSAILYSSGASEGGNVGLSASGVTLVFASVPGKVNENLTLKDFGAYRRSPSDKNPSFPFITMAEPDSIGYILQNNGNVAESPVGSFTLTSMFGQKTLITNVNPSGSLALIGQSRLFTTCIKLKTDDVKLDGAAARSNTCVDPGLWPGRYTIALDLFYGQNGNNTEEIVKTTSFWYLPGWFIALSVVVLGFIAYIVWRIVRAGRRRFGKRPNGSLKR